MANNIQLANALMRMGQPRMPTQQPIQAWPGMMRPPHIRAVEAMQSQQYPSPVSMVPHNPTIAPNLKRF